MRPGADTPEELENLLEDASVVQDSAALVELFEEGAVVLSGVGEARGREAIARKVAEAWRSNGTYVSGKLRVVQARDVALVISECSVAVTRRGRDGAWRYAIALPEWTSKKRRKAMSEENKRIVQREIEEIINEGSYGVMEELISPDYVAYDPTEAEPLRGREAFRESLEAFRSAFEGFQVRIDDQIAEADKVVTRWTFTGRHIGELFGVPPSGAQVEVAGMSFERLTEGRIIEDHMAFDTLGLLRQIGAVPELVQ